MKRLSRNRVSRAPPATGSSADVSARRARRCCCCMAAARRGMPGAIPPSLARTGAMAYALDQRGHGDSEWVADGAYAFADFAADARRSPATLTQRAASADRDRRVARRHRLAARGRKAERAGRGRVRRARARRHHAARRTATGSTRCRASCASARQEGFADRQGGGRCGRGLSAASAAPALPRRPEEEPAPASRRAMALALGPAHA